MNRRKLLLSAACLLLAAVLLSTGTFAWLNKAQRADRVYAGLSDFDVEGVLTFGDMAYENGGSILVPVSLKNGAENYIGGMKYVVRYTGASPACIRVRVLEQWIDAGANEIMAVSGLNYHISEDAQSLLAAGGETYPAAGSAEADSALAETGAWIDNRASDYCYYYSIPVQPRSIAVETADGVFSALGDGAVELTLIDQTKADNAALLSGIDVEHTQLSLLIEVEAVQPNRIREFFGIDALPVVK